MKKRKWKSLQEEFLTRDFRVAMYGSARIKKNDKSYKLIYELGRRIGDAGVDIVTGGGPGAMEAANRGHKAGAKLNGAHSLGLTIRLPKEQRTNDSLDIKENFLHFTERLDRFVLLSNVVVVTPGGIGTLLELIYTWQLIQVGHICNMPVVLYGEMWEELIEWMKKWQLKKAFIKKDDFAYIFLAKNADDAMEIILKAREAFQDEKNPCINIEKYKVKVPLKVRVM